MGDDTDRTIRVGQTADGDPLTLPVVEVLTGRAFLTGKSGAGKSNTASVVVEELLEAGFPVLIVDADGEYYGLKEDYELLHAGADEECDVQVSAEHAEKLATLALEENVPVILDVSGYLDADEADELVRETARHLFAKEKKLKKPFLLVVEECHEYVPEGGGMNETGKLLVKVGKRGRKHGLGILGVSQRPADVKKDFITQANWLVWHRLTWENDTKVVGRIVGSEYGDRVSDLDDGEAFLQADWTDEEVTRVQFKRKRTFDAGATPGLDDVERPDLKSVNDALTDELGAISDRQERREDRVAELEAELERKQERIADLERELEQARDVSAAARKMANALAHGDPDPSQTRFATGHDEAALDALRDRVADLEDALEDDEDAAAHDAELAAVKDALRRQGERATTEELAATAGDDGADDAETAGVDRHEADSTDADAETLLELLGADGVVSEVAGARRSSNLNEDRTWAVLARLAADGPLRLEALADRTDAGTDDVRSLLVALRGRSLVTRDDRRRYALAEDRLRSLADDGPEHDLRSQWRVG